MYASFLVTFPSWLHHFYLPKKSTSTANFLPPSRPHSDVKPPILFSAQSHNLAPTRPKNRFFNPENFDDFCFSKAILHEKPPPPPIIKNSFSFSSQRSLLERRNSHEKISNKFQHEIPKQSIVATNKRSKSSISLENRKISLGWDS